MTELAWEGQNEKTWKWVEVQMQPHLHVLTGEQRRGGLSLSSGVNCSLWLGSLPPRLSCHSCRLETFLPSKSKILTLWSFTFSTWERLLYYCYIGRAFLLQPTLWVMFIRDINQEVFFVSVKDLSCLSYFLSFSKKKKKVPESVLFTQKERRT